MFDEKSFIAAIEDCLKKREKLSKLPKPKDPSRSPESIRPIHNYFADQLQEIWCKKIFKVRYNDGADNAEFSVHGKYYAKDVDITIIQNDKPSKPVFCLGIKFVISSLSSNIYNYFEQMMGETANIQAKRIPYAQVIIFQHKTPKEDPSKGKNIGKIKFQNLRDQDIKKYLTLIDDQKMQYCPHSIVVPIIDIAWTKTRNKVSMTDVEKAFSEDVAKGLKKKLSLQHLFKEIKQYRDYYLSKHNG